MAAVPPLSPRAFAAAAGVAPEALSRLETYARLLCRWQRAVNLVGADTLDDLWRRHMLDSAQLARYLPAGARVVTDLGSGAGFPGLVLALVAPVRVHLIEATGRKAAFLAEAVRATGAAATVHRGRIEALAPWPSDAVTARALAPLDQLLALAVPFLGPATPGVRPVCLFLKGRRADEELTAARKTWKMTVERFASLADAGACVLRIGDVSRG